MAGVYYLQRFVAVERDGFRDFRLLVSRGRVIAAMVRHAAAWITNLKRGGRPVAAVVDAEMKALAVRAAAVGRRRFCRSRYSYGADGRADGARGQQHAGVVGVAEGHGGEYRIDPRRDVITALAARTRQEAAV